MTTETGNGSIYQSLTVWLAPEVVDWLEKTGQKTNRWSGAEYAAWLLEEAYATREQRDFHYGPEVVESPNAPGSPG